MASLVKLKDIRDVVGNLLVVENDESDNLINRAIARLYNQSATPDSHVLLNVDNNSITPYPTLDEGVFLGVDSVKFDSVAKFKHQGNVYGVIPLSSTFNDQGYDFKAFIDIGTADTYERLKNPDVEYTGIPYRIYKLPSCLEEVPINEITALVRLAFTKCVNEWDTFPIRSLEAARLAVMAVNYEEQNDLERASTFWSSAYKEMESSAARYDTGRTHRVSFDPNAAANNMGTMY